MNDRHRCECNSGTCQNEACLNRLSQCVLKCVDLSSCITLSCTLTIQCFMYSLIHLYRLRVFCEVSQRDQLPVGFIAQLGVQCSDIAEVMGLNPVQAWIFSYRFISQLLKCDYWSFLIYLSPVVQIYDVSNIHFPLVVSYKLWQCTAFRRISLYSTDSRLIPIRCWERIVNLMHIFILL